VSLSSAHAGRVKQFLFKTFTLYTKDTSHVVNKIQICVKIVYVLIEILPISNLHHHHTGFQILIRNNARAWWSVMGSAALLGSVLVPCTGTLYYKDTGILY
jgi:hypothetical protein